MGNESFTFAVAVNNTDTLRKNLLLSPGLQPGHKHQILVKEGYSSASEAYNSAIDEAKNEIIIFIHQDIYLPESWFADLAKALSYLDDKKINWGVMGCFGSRRDAHGGLGRVYTNGLGFHGAVLNNPEPIETLDEIVLIIKKSSGLRFDPIMPNFHLYGTDLCLTAQDKGMTNFAFQGFCVHNTNQLLVLPKEFYDCYWYLKKKWEKYLPIYASCLLISRFDKELRIKKLKNLIHKIMRKKRQPLHRVEDPRIFLDEKV